MNAPMNNEQREFYDIAVDMFPVGTTVFLGELDRPMVVTGHEDREAYGPIGFVHVAWYDDNGSMELERFHPQALRKKQTDAPPQDPRVLALARQVGEQQAVLEQQKTRLREYEASRCRAVIAVAAVLEMDSDTTADEAAVRLSKAYLTMKSEANEQLATMAKKLRDAGLA